MKKISFLLIALIAIGTSIKAQDTLALNEYTGKFIFPEGSIVSYVAVTAEKGKLSFSSSQGTGTLEKVAEDSFSIPEYQGTGKYIRNADKKVTGVVIDVMGYHMEGTKQEVVTTTFLRDRQPMLKAKGKQFVIS